MEQSSYKVDGQKTDVSCLDEKSSHLEKDPISDAVVDDSREFDLAGSEHADDKEKAIVDHQEGAKSAPGAENNLQESRKRKKYPQTVEPRTYALRSSLPKENNKTSREQLISTSNPIAKRGRKKRNQKNVLNDAFSLIRKRIRYLFNRINYEQNLIDAYSSEGWKGLSLEKIRPEKELERAKSEILRRKLRIRESFHHLDSLLSEGRLEEKLFDDHGEIDSENIFCAKCGSKESSIHNDIILCDGSCDRGFHQKCLNPPLPTHLIPPGDQSWFCPACDCKLDCLQLLNEYQGCNLSIEDTWEKVFPEAAAAANGNKQFDDSNCPTDDSEDDDYNPDVPEVTNEDQEEGSSSHESSAEESSEELDSTSASEDSGPPKLSNVDVLGLPSDDSEDDNYDPECADTNKDIQDKDLESSESDFTSDSDEFCAELSKITNADDATSSSLLDTNMADRSGEGSNVTHKDPINSGLLPIMEADLPLENSCPMPKRRQRERLDYKKLYDEAYAKASSDSSEDDEWNEKSTTKEFKKDNNRKAYPILPDATTHLSLNNQRNSGIKHIVEAHSDHSQVSRVMKESTSNRTHQYLGEQHVSDHSYGANGNEATTPVRRHFDQNVSQRLQEIFAENQYPSRQMKENLAEELGLTMKQIGKWFQKSRYSLRNSTTMGSNLPETSTVSCGETNLPGTAFPDKQRDLNKPSSMNNNSSKGNTNNATANENDKRPSEGNNRKNQPIICGNDKPKRTLDYDRQKAVERELRRMKKHR